MKIKTILTALTSCVLTAGAQVSAADKYNVLFIAIDDLKPMLGCYGDKIALSPNIDKLASQGVVFTNAHCAKAVCGPSRAALMTSLRPDRSKIKDLKTQIREVNPDVVTLTQNFIQQGYTAMGIGKIYDPRNVDGDQDKASWSLPFIKNNVPYNAKTGKPTNGSYHNPESYKNGTKAAFESADVPDDAYYDGAVANGGVKYIQQHAKGDKPFFIAVGFKKPHLPFVAPKKYWDMYKRENMPLAEFKSHVPTAPDFAYHGNEEMLGYSKGRKLSDEDYQRECIHGYYACISYIDAQVGKLIAALDASGQRENTLIVLWGDHGFHLGDHGLWGKHTTYEQSTRSPLIFQGPGVKGGRKVASPAELIDIYPTLGDLAGIKTPEKLDGVSLKPILDGSKEQVRPHAITVYHRKGRAGYAFRDNQYRYVAWVKSKKDDYPKSIDTLDAEELYDYKADPLETKNIANDPEQKERMEALRKSADEYFKKQAALLN
ncbi:iduronate-2-sulfatase [Oceaniferula spumae]|uniref:Iduronate-2-sulfatase n=1 Tax=Oceaniferula spumae TaxID=2979115 RepID=A0AAT9FGI0_9BACT